MKKLLCIAVLLAAVLFVNVADASIGSPMRHSTGYGATACTTCGHVAVARPATHVVVRHAYAHRPMHYGYAHHRMHHGFGHRRKPYVLHGHSFHGGRFACTRCGR